MTPPDDDLRATLKRGVDAWRDCEHPDEGDLERVEKAGLVAWQLLVTLTDAGRAALAAARDEACNADA